MGYMCLTGHYFKVGLSFRFLESEAKIRVEGSFSEEGFLRVKTRPVCLLMIISLKDLTNSTAIMIATKNLNLLDQVLD